MFGLEGMSRVGSSYKYHILIVELIKKYICLESDQSLNWKSYHSSMVKPWSNRDIINIYILKINYKFVSLILSLIAQT